MLARARCVGVEEAEALRGAQADGAGLKPRMPQPITTRSIRSLCGRGWDLRDMAHAASRVVEAALRISARIARLLNPKVMSAEAL